LTQILRDFKNQTFQDSELLIVRDGKIPEGIQKYINENEKSHPNVRFMQIKKDMGNMKIAPGTVPRNYGVSRALGDFCCFIDDDDRIKDTFLETLLSGMINDQTISVVQIAVKEARVYKNGDPEKIVFIPEIGLPQFPMMGHISTQSFLVKRDWVVQEPWRDEPEHDIRLLRRLIEKFKPTINITFRVEADIDGIFVRDLKDWVSNPPFYRG
jgi:glycosyltransferase involved in cell wall biosynthesis